MSPSLKFHETVKEVVLNWAQARDLRDAANILRTGRLRLNPSHVEQLRRFVAQVVVESLAELMLRATIPAASKPVHFHGVTLHAAQVARLTSWLRDQEPTALALGVSLSVWRHALDQAVGGTPAAEHSGADHSAASMLGPITSNQIRRFLGQGLSETAGMEDETTQKDPGVSLLSVRQQQKNDKG